MQEQPEKIVASAFAEARRAPISSPPFLETRILAELRLRHESRRASLWKHMALLSGASAAFCALAAFGIMIHRAGNGVALRAPLGQPMVVHMEMEKLDPTRVASAEIELPEGVHFYSKTHPELEGLRSVSVALSGAAAGRISIPFGIRGDEAGMREVRVRFRDKSGALLGEKTMDIRFEGNAS